MWGTKAEGNVDKTKCPDNVQPTDKYLRRAKDNLPPGTPVGNVNASLEGKTTLV